MKPLTKKQNEMVRSMEKEGSTYNPKEIWLRAWQIMIENHLTDYRIVR